MKFDSCQYTQPTAKPSKWIEQNRHPSGASYNMAFGFCQILDGLVRVFTLGFYHTRFTLELSRRQSKELFQQ